MGNHKTNSLLKQDKISDQKVADNGNTIWEWLVADMHQPKVEIVLFCASYQMWFCQKFLKNAKNNSTIVKIWLFLWKSTSGSTKIADSQFLSFKKAKNPEVADFGATRCRFQKNSQIFIILVLVLAFLSNFWQNHIW